MRAALRAALAIVCVSALAVCFPSHRTVFGSESQAGSDSSLTEKVGETAKKIGKKIEEGFKKTAKKIEDKHVPEKVEQKLKKAVDKTAEGFGKAERKIKEKLAD